MKSKALITHLLTLPLIYPFVIELAHILLRMTGCIATAGDLSVTCTISFLAPMYSYVIGNLLWGSFMFVFWLPVVILFYVVCIARLIGVYKRREEKPFRRYWFVLSVCSIWTYFLAYILFMVF